ncbi:MAG: hypothetical protein ACR2QW_13980 [bacterium]
MDKEASQSFAPKEDLLSIWLFATIPAILFWLTTPWGIGLSIDSVRYLEMAKILKESQSFSELGSHFPPLYPFLIQIFSFFSDSLIDAARLLQFFLVYLNAALAATIVYKLSGGSRIAALLIVVAITLRWDLFFLWHFAWSEALFSALLLGHYLVLLEWQKNDRIATLSIAGLVAGLACLTRYAGLPFIGMSLLAVPMIAVTIHSTQVVHRVIAFLVGAMLPLAAWALILLSSGNSAATREIGYKGIQLSKFHEGIQVIGFWFSHGHGLILGLAITGLLFVGGLRLLRQSENTTRHWVIFFTLSITAYIGFIVLSLLLVDAHIELQSRILFPSLILLSLVIGTIFGQELKFGTTVTKTVALCALLFFAAGSVLPMYEKALSRIRYGEGFANANLKNMPVWKQQEKYRRKNIVSNGPELVKIHMQADAELIPRIYNAVTGEPTTDFDNQMLELKRNVLSGETTLIYFSSLMWREYLPSARDVVQLMQVEPDYLDKNAMVFHSEVSDN